MAPVSKRKRPERPSIDGGDNRPSPHRPQNTNLGQHDRGAEMRDSGRRSSRGGQGGTGGGRGRRNDPRDNPNKLNISNASRATPTPGPMSPPLRPSSATQTPTQGSTPASELPSPIPKPNSTPYYYEILTDEGFSTWSTTGRQEVITKAIASCEDEDEIQITLVLQELTRATLDGRLDPNDAGSIVKQILDSDTSPADGAVKAFDSHTIFLDIFSMVCEAEDGPITSVLKNFLLATGVSLASMRKSFDGKLLQDLGLTRDTFGRIAIRQATNLLYRQANYNLLREESEGYSKLITELFTASAGAPTDTVADETFEHVKGLIGTFDLDVGRVLDITLDVFAAVLIKHCQFFIRFLKVSSWWPRSTELSNPELNTRFGGLPDWAAPNLISSTATEAEKKAIWEQERFQRDALFWQRARKEGMIAWFELGGRQVVDEATRLRARNAEGDADLEWIDKTGTFPPAGNHVAAQLLGFKLRFYASENHDKHDSLPQNLLYLAALLIKIGFISLMDLYPHISPLDEDMPAARAQRQKEIKEEEKANHPGGGMNALMMAGALPDDTLPNGGRTRENATSKSDSAAKPGLDAGKDKEDDQAIQKVQLLIELLTIGALPEALFILGRFPWIPELYPKIVQCINRILNYSIQDLYEKASPVSAKPATCTPRNVPDADQSGSAAKGVLKLVPFPVRKTLRWPHVETWDENENQNYRFYWNEWEDNVPKCQDVEDLFTLYETFLNLSGVGIGKDTVLFSRLIRIAFKNLTDDRSQTNLDRWQSLLTRVFVPALSMTRANAQIANELFNVLRLYPLATRYAIYTEWFQGPTSRLPLIREAFTRVEAETKSTMKRISKTNLSSMARSLAKTAFSSPGVVFRIALSQIESYDNLIDCVVNCAGYFTDLSIDVLMWSLLSSLGGKQRERNNADFVLQTSKWLLALSSFSGKVFKRYSNMDPTPILRYVNEQLYHDNATDLIILKELISEMAGIVPATDFNDDQLSSMTGGKELRRLALKSLLDKRHVSQLEGKRLMKALTRSELAGELLISLAQYKQSAIYRLSEDEAHIKLMAFTIDNTQATLFQYLDLLRSNLLVPEFNKHVPGILELMRDFGLDPALAFLISRESLAYEINKLPYGPQKDAKKSIAAPLEASQMKGTETAEENSKDVGSGEDVEMEDVNAISPKQSDSQVAVINSNSSPLDDLLMPIISAVPGIFPEGTFRAISPKFYTLFWTLAIGDLLVPQGSYQLAFDRRRKRITEMMVSVDGTRKGSEERLQMDRATKPVNQELDALRAEMKECTEAYEKKKVRLLENNSEWFTAVKGDGLSDTLLEKCIIPRLLISPLDADYCFKMIRLLHDNGVPHFRTLSLYARLFKSNRLRTLLFTCTMREAENLGRFLRLVLTDLARWHSDPKIYEREAWGPKNRKPLLPGFVKSAKALEPDNQVKNTTDLLQFEDKKSGFRSVLFGWHKSLNSALRDCLDATEWMHIRNAITVLKAVTDVFPAVNFMGNNFIKQLETLTAREKNVREDLSLTGNAVLVQLKKKAPKWVILGAFYTPSAESVPPNGSPEARSNQSALKPTAPEFKPQSRASSLGISSSKPTTHHDVEDGEVDDAKASKSGPATAKPLANPAKTSEPEATARPSSIATMENKRSEILDKREQIKRENRENAAKAAAYPSNSAIPPRPNISSTSAFDRTPNLPSRPDGPFPPRELIDRHNPRHGDRRDQRDARAPDPRDPRDPRMLDRSGGRPDRMRDFPSNDRRSLDSIPRDFGRSDRGPGNDRERSRIEPPPRWVPDSARENTLRDTNGGRINESGRLSRDNPPPRPEPSTERGGPSINADRPSTANVDRQEIMNPSRAALISADKDISRSGSPRRGREEGRDRPSSRPQSPRRHLPEKDHHDSRRDDRPSRNGMPDTYNSSRNRIDEAPPPAGPRSERSSDRPVDSRSAFQPTPQPPRPIDPDHGRLNSGPRQQPDPNFGRLNPNPTPDIPSGPRDRNPRNSRMPNPPPQHRELPRPPTPDKQPPTGPSSGRPSRRNAPSQIDTSVVPSGPAPSTPIAPSPASAIHPDRLKHLGPLAAQAPPPPPPQAVNQPIPSVNHSDRSRGYNNDPLNMQPPMNPYNNGRLRPHNQPVTATGPPSGPKGAQSNPSTPGSNGFGAPTGPASASERAARGGRRQLAGINTMLQQAGQQLTPDRTNFRGRGRMSTGIGPETPNSAPVTPVIPPPPPPGPPPHRAEPVQDGGRDLITPSQVDLITGAPVPAADDRDRERSSRRERSGRHSRRSSRSPARERESKRSGGPEEERSLRSEYRDRRDTDRESRHQVSTPSKDPVPARDVPSTRERGSDRGERDSSRRDGRDSRETPRDPHEAGWNGERGDRGGNGRSRDLRRDAQGEERRESRGSRGEDGGGGSGRKRRGEEASMESRGHDKRVRR